MVPQGPAKGDVMSSLFRFGVVAATAALTCCSFSQYTAIVLPLPEGYQYAIGNGATQGVYSGYSVPTGASGYHDELAILWFAGKPRDVTPPGQGWAQILNSRDGQHVGSSNPDGYNSFALARLWSNDGSSVDLHPSQFTGSIALGCGGGMQVGQLILASFCSECGSFVERHAVLWSGSAQSFMLLHAPTFDEARAVDTTGMAHVGSGYRGQTGQYRAMLWTNPSNVVDLHPAGFASSPGFGIEGDSQVGFAETSSGDAHAFLWRGSAASAIDLHPAATYSLTVAHSVSSNTQVGGGRTIATGPDRALAWRGSAASVIDLHRFLPEGYRLRNSIAQDVDA